MSPVEIVVGLVVVCSNALATGAPTLCKSRTAVFPSGIACAQANDNMVASINQENSSLPDGMKLKLALLECVPVDRPQLDAGS